jgi:hypothetical protein
MNKIILLLVLLFFAAPAQANEFRKKRIGQLTPQMMIKAAIEVLTLTPATPNVTIVQIKMINGRRRVVPFIDDSKRPSKDLDGPGKP